MAGKTAGKKAPEKPTARAKASNDVITAGASNEAPVIPLGPSVATPKTMRVKTAVAAKMVIMYESNGKSEPVEITNKGVTLPLDTVEWMLRAYPGDIVKAGK